MKVIEFTALSIVDNDKDKSQSIIKAYDKQNEYKIIRSDYVYYKVNKKYRGIIEEEIDEKKIVVKNVEEIRDKKEKYQDIKKMLRNFIIPEEQIGEIVSIYKKDTLDVINKRPYMLIYYGVKVEKIIEKIDFDGKEFELLKILIIEYILKNTEEIGHVYTEEEQLKSEVELKLKKMNIAFGEKDYEKALYDLTIENQINIGIEGGNNRIIYLRRYYEMEEELSKIVSKISCNKNSSVEDRVVNGFIKKFEKREFELNSQQKRAIKTALKNNISIISGLPGTGKTTVIKAIVEGMIQIYGIYNIEVVAMAGKAVERISSVTGIKGKTIHRLLNIDENNMDTDLKIDDVEAIIIDEASMINLELFYKLFKAISDKENIKIVIVGDYNQLPPIGAGQVFLDLINCCKIPVVTLDKVVRQERGSSIIPNSRKILSGNGIKQGKNPLFINTNDFYYIETKKVREETLKQIRKMFGEGYKISDIQILSPIKEGKNGVRTINNYIAEKINKATILRHNIPANDKIWSLDKVIQTVNNYAKNVYNGEIGYIKAIELEGEKIKAEVDFGDRIVVYNDNEINELEIAYATTAHKFQGSEVKVVILVVSDEHKTFLNRNLLYVAITRAKEKVIIIGQKDAFNYGVERLVENRNSKLVERINSL